MKTIVIISTQELWEEAKKVGVYTQSTIDSTLEQVGFIHCSTLDQTMEIVNRRFARLDNLLLLLVDLEKVLPRVEFEGARSGRVGIFPHIYGPLNTDAVYATFTLAKSPDGIFDWPQQWKKRLDI